MKAIVFLLGIAAALPAAAAGRSVVGSRHDLSVTGPGPIKAETETQVCVFCHVSHGGAERALGNRPDHAREHTPYESSTMRGRAGAPSGGTRVCLSCHDGTIAVGETRTRKIRMNSATAGGRIPGSRRSNLGTDLRKSHPVSVGAGASGKTRRRPSGPHVKLDALGQVQCTSCHDPHAEYGGTPEGKFLVMETRRSGLCSACHPADRSSHASSPRAFGPEKGNEQGFGSVAEAGCRACHRSHGADSRGRLVSRGEGERHDDLCLRCHDGQVAAADVARDLSKPYSHATGDGSVHDASEGLSGPPLPETSSAARRHAVCVDCHDPHAASASSARAPLAPGSVSGAWGIDAAGRRVDPARYEYEICFKCHGDSANSPTPDARGPRRALPERNLRRAFEPNAASYHPVVAPGVNADVPSLRAPWSVASQIYCSDCHASDSGPGAGGIGARGPHGSVYPYLLERAYGTADGTAESPGAYALCYKCHDREVLLSKDSAFRHHRTHVVDARAPCSVCHTAHGVAATAGNRFNNAHLVDFDTSVVRPSPLGRRLYESRGARSGACSLTCHGETHEARGY